MLLVSLLRAFFLVVVGLYLITLIVAAFFAERIIFQPRQAGYRDDPGILKLTSSDGAKISAKYLANPHARLRHERGQTLGAPRVRR